MARNLINAAHIRLLKPRPGKKLAKYHDGEGLYLWVHDNGKTQYKRWFFRYRFEGINKPEILLGAWPSVQASEAREKAEEMRQLLKSGVDPAIHRKAAKEAKTIAKNSFEMIAREWFAIKMSDKAEGHRVKVLASLENDVFPYLGNRPVDEVTAPEVLAVLRRVENRGAIETAHRIMGRCSMVFRYAVATGRCVSDPTRDLKDALKPVVKKHLAAVIDPEEVGRLLRVIDEYQGSQIVRCALKFAPLVFVRPGELRQAEWADIDLQAAEWSFTALRILINSATCSEIIRPVF